MTIQSFKANPDFLKEKGGLRKIVTALANIDDATVGNMSRQYHVALIVDKSLVFGSNTETSHGRSEWRRLKSNSDIDPQVLNSGILCAISMYPLKEMHEEVVRIEEASGDMAHPVFDHNGVVRWPR